MTCPDCTAKDRQLADLRAENARLADRVLTLEAHERGERIARAPPPSAPAARAHWQPSPAVADAAARDAMLHACLQSARVYGRTYLDALEAAAVEQAKMIARFVAFEVGKSTTEIAPIVLLGDAPATPAPTGSAWRTEAPGVEEVRACEAAALPCVALWRCDPTGEPEINRLVLDDGDCGDWQVFVEASGAWVKDIGGEWMLLTSPSSAPAPSPGAVVRGRVEEGRCLRCGEPCHDCAVRDEVRVTVEVVRPGAGKDGAA